MALGEVPQKMVDVVSEFALNTVPDKVGTSITSAMVTLIDMAIDGVGSFPSARHLAAGHMQRHGNVESAVNSLIRHHTTLATVQGVVTNIGGIVSLVVGTPANITGLIVIQVRMVACIAHLFGYDLDDQRVRTALSMCLLGDKELTRQISAKILPSTPAAVATSLVVDDGFHAQVANHILRHLLGEAAGKGVVKTVAKNIPLIGGGVGGISDWYHTTAVGHCAQKHLPIRRPMMVIPQYSQPSWDE